MSILRTACIALGMAMPAHDVGNPPRLEEAARGSVVWVEPAAALAGGVPIFYGEVVWVGAAPVGVATWAGGYVGTYTPVILTPAPLASQPSRVRLEGEAITIGPLGPPEPTPLEAAIAAEMDAIEALGLELQRRYARLVELNARREAGETDVPTGGTER